MRIWFYKHPFDLISQALISSPSTFCYPLFPPILWLHQNVQAGPALLWDWLWYHISYSIITCNIFRYLTTDTYTTSNFHFIFNIYWISYPRFLNTLIYRNYPGACGVISLPANNVSHWSCVFFEQANSACVISISIVSKWEIVELQSRKGKVLHQRLMITEVSGFDLWFISHVLWTGS